MNGQARGSGSRHKRTSTAHAAVSAMQMTTKPAKLVPDVVGQRVPGGVQECGGEHCRDDRAADSNT